MSTQLEAILKTALLGTERRPLPAGAETTEAPPARTALEALATLFLRRKAGFRLALAPDERPLSAPIDERPVCRPAAVQVLQQMLTGLHVPALREFVTLLTQTGQRLPPEILPAILHKGLEDRILFEQLEPLLGPVGHWLGQQHLRWRALLPDPGADWFTAAFDDRLRLLRTMRRRSPLAALAWLEASWQQESSVQQVRFLEALQTGLSAFDAPLLQRAAADKKDAVRMAALRLLDLWRLSPAEILQLATARHPDEFPAGVLPEHWPKAARLALFAAAMIPADALDGAWPELLAQLVALDRSLPVFFNTEEIVRLIAYYGELNALEMAFQTALLPPETGQQLANILSFRRKMAAALAPEN